MFQTLPVLKVGNPLRHEALSIFPLFSDSNDVVDYWLSDSALAQESLIVEEVNEGGSVPELLVDNQSDTRVLFLEGEELVGAKQNRILNTSVLVPAHSKIKIPVSCVEQGRWRYQSRFFASSGSHSPGKLRRALKASVSKAVKEKRAHRSDQSEIWDEVCRLQSAHDVASGTGAMADAFEAYQDKIAVYGEHLKYVEGATGAAVAVGDRIVMVDVFDKSSTCEKVWDRLLSGVVFDALEHGDTDQHASVDDVEQFIGAINDLPCQPAAAVGEGEEYRAESDHGDHASALALESTVIHGSAVAAI